MWAPGDLALCVSDADWHTLFGPDTGPRKGEVNEVVEVEPLEQHVVSIDGDVYDGEMLYFAKWPLRGFWHGVFKKLDPLSDDEKREFAADLRYDDYQLEVQERALRTLYKTY